MNTNCRKYKVYVCDFGTGSYFSPTIDILRHSIRKLVYLMLCLELRLIRLCWLQSYSIILLLINKSRGVRRRSPEILQIFLKFWCFYWITIKIVSFFYYPKSLVGWNTDGGGNLFTCLYGSYGPEVCLLGCRLYGYFNRVRLGSAQAVGCWINKRQPSYYAKST